MVVHAFPVAKLGALLLKQISKPIANAVKQQAIKSPIFRKYICLPPAQAYNWCEKKAKMWMLNLGKPINFSVLDEGSTIELGANLLGEGIIFVIAAGIIIAEYNRSARKEATKEDAKQQEIDELKAAVRDLFFSCEEQNARIRELTRIIVELESKRGKKDIVSILEKSPKNSTIPTTINCDEKIVEDVNYSCGKIPDYSVVILALNCIVEDLRGVSLDL